MKKLITLLIALFAVTMVTDAQISLKENDTYKTYTGLNSDSLADGTHANLIYLGEKDFEYNYFVEMDIDREASTGDYVDCSLRGSNDGLHFYNLTTVRWQMTTADTTISYNSFSGTATHWRYLQLYHAGKTSSAKASLSKIRIRILEE